jgi:hypothetical protein
LTSLTKNGGSHGIPNFQNNGCVFYDKHIYVDISTENDNPNYYFPYWYAGDYYDFTFSASSSFSGDIANNPNLLFVSTTIVWRKSVYYRNNNNQCGHANNDCRRYYDWGTFLLSGGNTLAYNTNKQLASSYSIDLISRQKDVETELSITVNNMLTSVGPSQNTFLAFHTAYADYGVNNFPYTRSS